MGLAYATEDDVREEFVTPLLRLLGYDFGRGEILRAKRLPTPYYSGTKRKEHIVPDYIVRCDTHPVFVIDAKAPSEDPTEHRYVAQVHSYASHRSVAVEYFVVTNAHRTLIYETSSLEFRPVLDCALSDLNTYFPRLTSTLGSAVWHRLVRLKESFTSAQAFFVLHPEADEGLLNDLISAVSQRLAASSRPYTRRKKARLYLDTSVVLALAFRDGRGAKALRERMTSAEVVVSSYVLKELNQTVIKEAATLFGIVNGSATLAEALRQVAEGSVRLPRTHRLSLVLLSHCMRNGVSRDDVLRALRMILASGAMGILPEKAQVLDVLGCPLASAMPEAHGTEFALYSKCVRAIHQCNVASFLSSKVGELTRFLASMPRGGSALRVRSLMERVVQCPDNARGIRSCSFLGDALIALQQPSDSTLVTLDPSQVALAACLGNDVELVAMEKASA